MAITKNIIYDIAIVGAGIVGLATAYQLAKRFKGQLKIVLLEKESQVAQHQSGRNSGVIHSGVYYKPNSLKAKLCTDGRKQLITFAKNHKIPFKLSGKIIVACKQNEINGLQSIFNKGLKNKVNGLELIDAKSINNIEPNCQALQAIWVPTAGVINYKQVCQQLKLQFEQLGGKLIKSFDLQSIRHKNGGYTLNHKTAIKAKHLLCCGGAQADRLALMEGLKPSIKIVPFKGEYYKLLNPNLVNGLIYPVPNPNFPFLGVHFTKGINGNVECGPNAVLGFHREAQKRNDFNITDNLSTLSNIGFWKMGLRHFNYGFQEQMRSWNKSIFLKSLQAMMPCVKSADINKSRFGVRAVAIKKDGTMPDDFIFEETPTSIHVLSAPSPAATASLAIGNYICNKAIEKFKL